MTTVAFRWNKEVLRLIQNVQIMPTHIHIDSQRFRIIKTTIDTDFPTTVFITTSNSEHHIINKEETLLIWADLELEESSEDE